MSPRVFTNPGEAQAWARDTVASGRSLGLVPTMGALHDGHLQLVQRAGEECDASIVSVFVNPLQFNDPGDLERYPRDLDADVERLSGVGCGVVFTGSLAEFFPGALDAHGQLDPARFVDPGPCSIGLEGEFRPGHFRGVATIVDRLFEIVEPTRAYFGAKDFQQCLVADHVARRRPNPEVVVCPTVRDPDGLAMSSRNLLLSAEGRAAGLAIPRALVECRRAWRAGQRDAGALASVMQDVLATERFEVEYAEVRDPEAWTDTAPCGDQSRAVALIAGLVEGRVGTVRLLDNLTLDIETEVGPWGA